MERLDSRGQFTVRLGKRQFRLLQPQRGERVFSDYSI
jgi:hypothetical protein